MGSRPHVSQRVSCIGLAVGELLKDRYPFHTAKMVAADLGCTVKAAENLLSGHLSAKTMTRLATTYGLGLLVDAWAAVTGEGLEQYILEQARAARREQHQWERREQEYQQLHAALSTEVSRGETSLRQLDR